MKKSLIICGLLLVLCLSLASALDCIDSDGKDYFNKGVVTAKNFEAPDVLSIFEDYCGVVAEEEDMLVEYTCNYEDDVVKDIYDCLNGCINGVCINPMVTETITCVFEDSNEKEKCQNFFYYGYLQPLFNKDDLTYTASYYCEGSKVCALEMGITKREDVLSVDYSEDCRDDFCSFDVTFDVSKGMVSSIPRFNCQGKGNCSMEVTAEEGTKLRWNTLCRERNMEIATSISEGYKIDDALASKEMTVVDGIDETVSFDCKGSLLDDFVKPIYEKSIFAVKSLFHRKEKGQKLLYYICHDGTEKRLINSECKLIDFDSYDQLCENYCDRFGEKCGLVQAYSEKCLL